MMNLKRIYELKNKNIFESQSSFSNTYQNFLIPFEKLKLFQFH